MVTNDLGACEWFVWDLRRSSLIDRGQLDQIVSEFLKKNPRAEAPALAEHLVRQGTLTAFQAERVLNAKTQGLVLGPYVLLDGIGQGSMGQVFKANSKNDSNLYAIKILPRRSMWNVRLARRQVRSFGQFSHPAVIPFVDVGTSGGLHYLAWPLAEGETLEHIVQQNSRLSPDQSAQIGVHIAQGLFSAHNNNIFHGLIKPSNIMLGTDQQTRILDFGIGSLLVENEGESLVDTMSTANTLTSGLDCASPESIMDPTNRTPAGDQYSLGCVLYYCLTGRVPFPEGNAVEKMMAHQHQEPPAIQDFSPECPEGLILVVQRLMAKKPESRFNAMDEVVEALEPYLGEFAGAASAAENTMNQSSNGSTGRMNSLNQPSANSRGRVQTSTPARSTSGLGAPTGRSGERVNFGPIATPGRSNAGISTPIGSGGGGSGRSGERGGFGSIPAPKVPTRATPFAGRGNPPMPNRSGMSQESDSDEIMLTAAQPQGGPQYNAHQQNFLSASWTGSNAEPRKKPAFGMLAIGVAAALLGALVFLGIKFLNQ